MTDPKPPTRELFEVALALAPDERVAFLAQHCADAAQRAIVERMLAVDADAAAHVLDDSFDALLDRVGDSRSETETVSPIGSSVGPFTLEEKLGEGGSSIVFRATREQAGVTQTVALKLLRRGLYSNEEQRRFRSERLALAQLRHPGIARLIEGGVTAAGVPYIALELIDGKPITEYAREQRLDLRHRLQLFVAVCRAVEAAHRALIVHRDLKPSNVLVTHDGDVKLLDFGIAKLLDAEADEDVTHTQHHAMTPAYAAPEQFSHGAITTATDVYSLGVLLAELITGGRREPGDSHTPSSQIGEVSTPGVLPASPKVTRRQLRGDLDNVVLKATADDPERRYTSAGAFADDIERHLAGQPVAAHPPSTWYRTRKFVARHKGGVLTTAAFLLAVFAALGFALWQANVARQQARRADEQAARAVAVRDFLVSLLDAAQAKVPAAEKPTVDVLVASARERVNQDAALLPSIRADVMVTLGMVSMTYGDLDTSRELLEKALAIKRDLYAEDDPERWSAAVQLANAIERLGRFDEADRLLRPLLPYFRAHDSKIAIEGLEMLTAAEVRTGKVDAALDIAHEAAAMGARVMRPDSREALTIAAFPGKTLSLAGKSEATLAALEPIVQRWHELGLSPDVSYSEMLNNLAVNKIKLGDYRDGEALLSEAIGIARGISPLSPVFATNLRNLGRVRVSLGLYAEAEAPLHEALDIDRHAFASGSIGMLGSLVANASLQKEQGHIPAAETYLLEASTVCATAEGAKNDMCARIRNTLATIRLQQQRLDEAASLASEAFEQRKQLFGETHPNVAEIQTTLADIALRRAKATEAIELSSQAEKIFTGANLMNGREAVLAKVVHANALIALHRSNEALAEIEPAIARWQSIEARATPLMFRLLTTNALASAAAGDAAAARAHAQQALTLGVPAEAVQVDDLRAARRLATP
ncbi:MAG: serine/threonine-protein kinase [Dokdonella sp.]